MSGLTCWTLLVTILIAFASSSCGEEDERLTIFAASSLTDVLPALIEAHESTGGSPATSVLGGSNHMAAQLRDGAPGDVFITADITLGSNLAMIGSPTAVASNHLVVAIPKDNPGAVSDLEDLYRTGLRLALCAPDVPCGKVTSARFGNLPADTEEPSVRAVLARLALGEADIGIVYATDLANRKVVAAWDQPLTCPCVTYAAIALTGRGLKFAEFLIGPTGQSILTDHGFASP